MAVAYLFVPPVRRGRIAAFCFSLTLIAVLRPVVGLNIILNFDYDRSESWFFDPVPIGIDGTPLGPPVGLSRLFQYAEIFYEDVFEDSHTLAINYWYEDLPGELGVHSLVAQSGGRETVANIRIDTRDGGQSQNWFIDPTPEDDAEFDMQQTLWRELSSTVRADWYSDYTSSFPQMFEVGYGGLARSTSLASGKTDMLSVVLHEVGHALGMTPSLSTTVTETIDGDYDFNAAWTAGYTIAVETANVADEDHKNIAHLENSFALMHPTTSNGRRRPSHTDLFAMATAHKYTVLDVPRREFYGGSSWISDADWTGARRPGADDDAFVRHGGSIRVNTAGATARNLTIAEATTLNVTAGSLTLRSLDVDSTSTLTHSGGEIRVVGGTLEIFGKPLSVSGTSTPTFYLQNKAVGLTAGVVLGGTVVAGPAVFVPAPGTLRIDSKATMNTNGNVVLGAAGIPGSAGAGTATVDDAVWYVNGTVTLASIPTATPPRLIVQNGGKLFAGTIQTFLPTSELRVTSGEVGVEHLLLPLPGVLQHTGGKVEVFKSLALLDHTIAGLGSPELALTNSSSGATRGLTIGSALLVAPNVWTPAPGSLRIDEFSVLTTSGNVLLGAGIPPWIGPGTATIDNGVWHVLGAMTIGPSVASGVSKVIVQNDGVVTADLIQSVTPYGQIQMRGGRIDVETLSMPVPGGVHHTGGEITVRRALQLPEQTIAGTGNPVLRITDGALATTGGLVVGGFAQIAPGMFQPASGELHIELGATVNTTGNVLLGGSGAPVVGPGQAYVDNGTWNVNGSIQLATQSTTGVSRLNIAQGGRVKATTIHSVTPTSQIVLYSGRMEADTVIAPFDNFVFTGGDLQTNVFVGNLHQQGGVVNIKAATGQTEVNGSFRQTGGVLAVNLGGTTPGSSFDVLDVFGQVTLAGGLQVSLVNGFTPTLNDSFAFLTAGGGVAGQFSLAASTLPDLNDGLSWQILYLANSVLLTVAQAGATGDFNEDGRVTGADFLVWQRGESSSPWSADDLMLWQSRFGAAELTVPGSAIPEPTTGLLAAISVALAARRRLWRVAPPVSPHNIKPRAVVLCRKEPLASANPVAWGSASRRPSARRRIARPGGRRAH